MTVYVYITDENGTELFSAGWNKNNSKKLAAFDNLKEFSEYHRDELGEEAKDWSSKKIVYLQENDGEKAGKFEDGDAKTNYGAKEKNLIHSPNIVYITSELSYEEFKKAWKRTSFKEHDLLDANKFLAGEDEQSKVKLEPRLINYEDLAADGSSRKIPWKRLGLFFLHPGNYALMVLLALILAGLIQAGVIAGSVVAAIAVATAALSMALLTGIVFLALYKFAKNKEIRAYFDTEAPSGLQKFFRALGFLGVVAALILGIGYAVAPSAAFSFMAPVFTTMVGALTAGFSSMAVAGGTLGGLAAFMPAILPITVILFVLTPFILAATLDRIASRPASEEPPRLIENSVEDEGKSFELGDFAASVLETARGNVTWAMGKLGFGKKKSSGEGDYVRLDPESDQEEGGNQYGDSTSGYGM